MKKIAKKWEKGSGRRKRSRQMGGITKRKVSKCDSEHA